MTVVMDGRVIAMAAEVHVQRANLATVVAALAIVLPMKTAALVWVTPPSVHSVTPWNVPRWR